MIQVIDSKDRIARTNIYTIFGEFTRKQIHNNVDGELLLRKVGLTQYFEKYKDELCPFWYNRGYQNVNDKFNPEYVCLSICEDIETNEEVLIGFLNKILEGVVDIEEKIYNKLRDFLGIIGYELLSKIEIDEISGDEAKLYSLTPSAHGTQQRNDDISYLYKWLQQYHPDLLPLYNEAISNFGAGQYTSCIENCRSLFESFFKKLDTTDNDYVKGILAATGETITDNGASLTSVRKIYTYWIENKKGANRFRLFQTMYSSMSGLGIHHEDVATKDDALLLLRYTEDCLLWCFRRGVAG